MLLIDTCDDEQAGGGAVEEGGTGVAAGSDDETNHSTMSETCYSHHSTIIHVRASQHEFLRGGHSNC